MTLWKYCPQCLGLLGFTGHNWKWWECPHCGYDNGDERVGLVPKRLNPSLIHDAALPEVVENHEAVGV